MVHFVVHRVEDSDWSHKDEVAEADDEEGPGQTQVPLVHVGFEAA